MPIMTAADPPFTFGIEEEYHLVDSTTRDLAPAPPELLAALESALGEQVSPEYLASQIEVATKPCRSAAEARAELNRLRSSVINEAGRHGLGVLAASSHPFAVGAELPTTEKPRYRALARDLAGAGRQQAICGLHVHVGIDDPELRIEVMNQVRYFLPHLLVLSASSPFWEGEDTGLASYRLIVNQQLPRAGLPGRFAGWDEYASTVAVLVDAGVIEDASKIWWDLRPSSRFPTLEMRITDVCPLAADTITIACLYVCLCRMLYRLRRANLSWRTYPVFLLAENRWRAQRYGMSGTLFDLGKGALVPFAQLLDELLMLIAEDAAALGCTAEVERARDIVRRGSSAERQRAAFTTARDQGATPHDALCAVVDAVIEETRRPA
jgi:carboxylate-amine ligase